MLHVYIKVHYINFIFFKKKENMWSIKIEKITPCYHHEERINLVANCIGNWKDFLQWGETSVRARIRYGNTHGKHQTKIKWKKSIKNEKES